MEKGYRGAYHQSLQVLPGWKHMSKNAGKEVTGRPTTDKLGTKACAPYNAGKCNAQANHPAHMHICAYCLSAAWQQCHQEHFCGRKFYNEAAKNGDAAKN